MTKEELAKLFEANEMRLTRPRLLVAQLLLMDGVNRHVSAEWVANELERSNSSISLASVYNTLNNFADLGLLRQIQIAGSSVVFDTNTTQHHHFLKESTGELIDIPVDDLVLSEWPQPPKGHTVKGWDIVVRID